ncbi:MAG: hypothetical protein ABI402_11060 [Ferruginibacter sp.]
MAKARTNPKKEIQAYILEALGKSLEKVKEGMSEKKFNRNIIKASKLIAEDFKFAETKKEEVADKKKEKAVSKKKEKVAGKKKDKPVKEIETAP